MPDTCKQTLELTVPVVEVEKETERVVQKIQQRVKLPGFRPGKAPLAVIRARFQQEIRQDVLDNLVPRVFRQRAERDQLKVVGAPGVTDVHFHPGEPLKFTVEFETVPEFDLGEYQGLTVPYREPEATEEDVGRRLEELREQKAEYVNIDPRPAADGDYAVVALRSLAGVEGNAIRNDEMVLHIGAAETLSAFSENLRGMSSGEENEFDVTYPADFAGQQRLAGKTVRFQVTLKGLRRKELPELNNEFAADVGDFKNLDELREELRRTALREREAMAQRDAKNALVDQLVEMHPFPVPEAFVERQLDLALEQRVRLLAAEGIDPRKLDVDWRQLRESMRERAGREVKASMLLDRIAGREVIETTTEELDREVHRIARAQREPAAAVRARLEKDGALGRIANQIRTEKTLSFLFEHARKVTPEPGGETAAG